MIRRVRLLPLLLFALLAIHARAQVRVSSQPTSDTSSIDLRGLAAFRPGDDEVWRSKYIDEREGEWNFIPVPGAWERAGYGLLDGFAWYRIRFRLPASLRDDSLLLVMSAVNDADEAYLNGTLIGETGAFPPVPRSEFMSLRVYPLPRALREEFNLLAVRVFDMGDSGGVTGSIFRIIRADSLGSMLDEIVDAPFRPAPMFITNGVAVSAVDPAGLSVQWTKPHLFHELDNGLPTEPILTAAEITVGIDGIRLPLSKCTLIDFGYAEGSGILKARFHEGLEVYWYHPRATRARALVVELRYPREGRVSEPGLSAVFSRNYWAVREIPEKDLLEQRHHFLLVWNACCDELAQRDLEDLVRAPRMQGHAPYTVEAELHRWEALAQGALYAPEAFMESERSVYLASIALLRGAQVTEEGAGKGQFVSAFSPATRARCVPRDHFTAVAALAEAGHVDAVADALSFARNASTGDYALFSVYGEEFGVGYPYIVTPAWYLGNGGEKRWARPDQAQLGFDGSALYLEALDAQRRAIRRSASAARPSSAAVQKSADSLWLRPQWPMLSARVADVLLFARDSAGLIPHDASPWGPGLSRQPSIYSSLHASAALFIAARYAQILGDGTKSYLYRAASQATLQTIRRLIISASSRSSAADLTAREQLLFHPLLIDGILLGLFEPHSPEARFALEMSERSFAVDDAVTQFNAQPDGDCFARMARPQLTLRLARAYAICGFRERAEQLFRSVTDVALRNGGIIPELIDPVSGSGYGAIPAIGAGAAEYVLAAEEIARMRAQSK